MKSILDYIFYCGIVMLPFVGTLSVAKKILFPLGSGLFLFTLIGTIVFFITTKKILNIDKLVNKSLIYLFFVVILSGIVNGDSIFNSAWQGVDGIGRYILSVALLLLEYFMLVYIYNIYVVHKEVRYNVHRFIIISFYISSVCGVVEIISLLGVDYANNLLLILDKLYREDIPRQMFRVQAFASEPSLYAEYLLIVLPILMLKVIEKGKIVNWFLLYILVILLICTFSRTGYFVGLFEITLFGCFFSREIIRLKKALIVQFLLFAIMLILLCNLIGINWRQATLVVESLLSNDYMDNLSNVARFGSMVAGWNIFKDNIILGIGYDQFAFYAADYYPTWSYLSPEIMSWSINYTERSYWPPLFNYYIRIMAELGLIGGVAWCFLLLVIIKYVRSTIATNKHNSVLKVYLIIFISQLLSLINSSDFSDRNVLILALMLAECKLCEGIGNDT